ncbi:MAG: ybhR [Parachlamydiales bacterium]|nr:ybhR [Parachlamydiales bacterium]
MQRIISLIIKELLNIWRDKKSRISILIPPVIQLLIFTFSATLDVKNVPIGILNRDNGKQSFELVQRFRGAPTFSRIVHLQAIEEIAPFIDNQKGIMVVSIDEQFSRSLDGGRPATVQLIFDGRRSNTAQIVAGYTNNIIAQFNVDFAAQNQIRQQNTALFPYNWYNPNILYYWYNVPCLVVIISMLTCLIVTSISVARERELGTFDQLLVSPLVPVEILIGKIIPGIIVGMLEGTIILTVGILVFQVPFTGSFLLLYLTLFVFVCAISGVGLFISSLCSTQQQAMMGIFVFMTPAILLSGFATPIENMPTWLQPATYLFPVRYMLVISKGIFLKAMPASIVLAQTWPMIVISIFTQMGAALSFRRKLV